MTTGNGERQDKAGQAGARSHARTDTPSGGRPPWLSEVVEAASEWYEAAGGDQASEEGEPFRAGRVECAGSSGWYSLVLRGKSSYDSDQLDRSYLAPDDGGEQQRFGVRDSVQDGDVLKILVAPHAPREGLFLWVPRRGKSRLQKALLDGLKTTRAEGVHEAFGLRTLDAIEPPDWMAAGQDGNSGQDRAVTACLSPGLQIVWGPPGTGKTSVIARAVEAIVAAGKTVLLVSGTNVAVDNALERAAQSLSPDDEGVMIRVGTPQVAAVAEDDRLSLIKLRNKYHADVEQARADVEEKIKELERDPAKKDLERTRAMLDAFDRASYDAASARIENERRLNSALEGLQEAQTRLWKANAVRDAALEEFEVARVMLEPAREAREHLLAEKQLQDELREYGLKCARSAANVQDLGEQIRAVLHSLESLPSGWKARRSRKQLRDQHARLCAQLGQAQQVHAEREHVRESAQPGLESKIRHHQASAAPYTLEGFDHLRSTHTDAEKTLDAAEEPIPRLRAEVDEHNRTMLRTGAEAQPSEADRELVANAVAAGLPEMQDKVLRLEYRAELVRGQLDRLRKEHEDLIEELRRLGRDAEWEIIRKANVVATTLAMLRLKKAVRSRSYDYVIVDEAAASTVPETIYAVSRASTGAVMLGDFLQNGPILDGLDKSANPAVQTWFNTDCFAVFGIRDPSSASSAAGCVALSEQYRFGPAINQLTNAVAYRGMLKTASAATSEIVFVDIDGLGTQLRELRRNPDGGGRWWTIGALVARALGEHHVAGGPVGIVTPYAIQRDAVQGMLADAGADPRIETKTSHGFQGREFDTVIFDMVDDGAGWISQGALNGTGYELSGLRLFNVGVTRARRRLYLIGDSAAVHRTPRGPFQAISQMIKAGQITVVNAAEVLGLAAPEVPSGPVRDLWDALRPYVKIGGIYDEVTLPGELLTRIGRAERSIWVWSPWVARRLRDFLPELRAAQDRGVRVRILALPTDEVSKPFHPYMQELRDTMDHVVFVKKEHQKLVIIDEQLTFIGSMNVLSHSRNSGRRETMTLIESTDYARRILRHERADEFAHPAQCPQCQMRMNVAALSGSGKNRAFHWWCYNELSDEICMQSLPFQSDPEGRNQPRSQPSSRRRK